MAEKVWRLLGIHLTISTTPLYLNMTPEQPWLPYSSASALITPVQPCPSPFFHVLSVWLDFCAHLFSSTQSLMSTIQLSQLRVSCPGFPYCCISLFAFSSLIPSSPYRLIVCVCCQMSRSQDVMLCWVLFQCLFVCNLEFIYFFGICWFCIFCSTCPVEFPICPFENKCPFLSTIMPCLPVSTQMDPNQAKPSHEELQHGTLKRKSHSTPNTM